MMRMEEALISSDSESSWLPVYSSKDVGYQLFLFYSREHLICRCEWVGYLLVFPRFDKHSTLPSFASRKRKGFANNSRGAGTFAREQCRLCPGSCQWILFMHNLFGREILICLQKFVRPGNTPTRRRKRGDENEDAFWMCSNQQPKVATRRI